MGELWGIDALTISSEALKEFHGTDFAYFASTSIEEAFILTLSDYLKFARDVLHLEPPLRFMAGATDVKGYRMSVQHRFERYAGNVVDQHIVYDGGKIDDIEGQAAVFLQSFFDYFWEECGLERSDYR